MFHATVLEVTFSVACYANGIGLVNGREKARVRDLESRYWSDCTATTSADHRHRPPYLMPTIIPDDLLDGMGFGPTDLVTPLAVRLGGHVLAVHGDGDGRRQVE
jgi:hypothetical protein